MTDKEHPSVWNNLLLIPGLKYVLLAPWFLGIGICIIGVQLITLVETGKFVDHKGNPWP